MSGVVMAAGIYFTWASTKSDYSFFHSSYEERDSKVVAFQTMEVSSSQLRTDTLSKGGTVLAFTSGKNNFLAHFLFSEISSEAIIDKINKNFDVKALKADSKFSIVMWRDTFLTNDRPLATIKTALETLGLENKLHDITEASEIGLTGYLGVNCNGTFENLIGEPPVKLRNEA